MDPPSGCRQHHIDWRATGEPLRARDTPCCFDDCRIDVWVFIQHRRNPVFQKGCQSKRPAEPSQREQVKKSPARYRQSSVNALPKLA